MYPIQLSFLLFLLGVNLIIWYKVLTAATSMVTLKNEGGQMSAWCAVSHEQFGPP